MTDLTPPQRRALRARAHHLHPLVSIGHRGLTPQVLREIDAALAAHGLIKVRVHSDDREAREAMLAAIAAALQAAPVQHLGKLLVLWREPDEVETPEPKPVTSRKAPVKAAARTVPGIAAKRAPRAATTPGPASRRQDEGLPREGRQPRTAPAPATAARTARKPASPAPRARGAGGWSSPPRGPKPANPRRRRGTGRS